MSEKTRKLVEAVLKHSTASKPTAAKSKNPLKEDKSFGTNLTDRIVMLLDDGAIDINRLHYLAVHVIDFGSYDNEELIDNVIGITRLPKPPVSGAVIDDEAFFFAMPEDAVIEKLSSPAENSETPE